MKTRAILKEIKGSVKTGVRSAYHNEHIAYEDRSITAVVSICTEAPVILGQKFYPTKDIDFKLPKDLEDKFVQLWHEVEKYMEDETKEAK